MTAVTFERVERRTVPVEIRERVVEAIRAGHFPPGTPLPAERVLCEEFGVARTSVREAIQGLITAGYVERRGNRSVVVERLPSVRFEADDRKIVVSQLFEVRKVIEPAIAELATTRANDDERAEIAELAAQDPPRPRRVPGHRPPVPRRARHGPAATRCSPRSTPSCWRRCSAPASSRHCCTPSSTGPRCAG